MFCLSVSESTVNEAMHSPVSVGTGPVLEMIPPSFKIGIIFLVTISAVATFFVLARFVRRHPWIRAVIVAAVAIRLPYMVLSPIHDDSVLYAERAMLLLDGRFGEVPARYFGVEVVMAGFSALFGPSGTNLASFSASIGTVVAVGALGMAVFEEERTALAAAVSAAVLPMHIYYSWWAYSEPIALVFFLTALWLLVRRSWRLATLVAAPLLFMRAEYLFGIFLPCMFLQLTRKSRAYYLPAVAPAAAYPFIFALPRSVAVWIARAVNEVGFDDWIPFFLLDTVLLEPFTRISENIVFYAPHLLYWGVPYYSLPNMNPVLPLLMFAGIYELIGHDRLGRWGLVIGTASVIVSFLIRETIADTTIAGIVALTGLGAAFVLILLMDQRERRSELIPLFAMVPYLALLLAVFTASRYLLPVLLVLSIYAGHGAIITYERYRPVLDRIRRGESTMFD